MNFECFPWFRPLRFFIYINGICKNTYSLIMDLTSDPKRWATNKEMDIPKKYVIIQISMKVLTNLQLILSQLII